MPGYAFISYSRQDASYVGRLRAHLRAARIGEWADEHVEYGDKWLLTIEKRITECAAFVPVMSEDAQSSKWVRREILLAEELGKPILPVLLSGNLPWFLREYKHEPVSHATMPTDAFVQRLGLLTLREPGPATTTTPVDVVAPARLVGVHRLQAAPARFAGPLVHRDGVLSVDWSSRDRIASGCCDHAAGVWDPETGQSLSVLTGHRGVVTSVGWSPDGTRLATASTDRTACVWAMDEPRPRLVCTVRHARAVLGVAWSVDGRQLATAGEDGTARILDPDLGTTIRTLEHPSPVRGVAWSPTGHLATAGSDEAARVWDAEKGTVVLRLGGHRGPVDAVAWSPEGLFLATAGRDRTAQIWQAQSGRVLTGLTGHRGAVSSVAWSADGDTIATGSADKTARIWNAESGTELRVLRGHTGAVSSVAWSTDGHHLATGGADDVVRIWSTRADPPRPGSADGSPQ